MTSGDAHGLPGLVLQGETLLIPHRIYNPEPSPGQVRGRVGDELTVLGCLYSRHHDGFVRQRSLAVMLRSRQPWVVPFVVQLLGEYVVEITVDVERFTRETLPRRPEQRRTFATFLAENPGYTRLTEQRATSYWSAYYRRQYPSVSTYPALRALRALRDADRDPSAP